MSNFQLLAVPTLPKGSAEEIVSRLPKKEKEVVRQRADYHPTVWGDHFLNDHSLSCLTNVDEKEVGKLKVEVKEILMATDDGPTEDFEMLDFIDKIQRLGIAYHFEKQIEQVLETVYNKDYLKSCRAGVHQHFQDYNLHKTSLLFRLLRQQGYYISCDVFNKFKDSKGNFDESLTADTRGLLSLYEASYMSIHGEDILDEARAFTMSNLKSTLLEEDKLDSSVAAQVKQALKHSLRRGLTRLNAWHYINIYHQTEEDSSLCQVLLITLAKLDFNLLQKQHQRELHYITKWWKDLEVEKNFPFARDRITECYFWILGVFFEPEYLIGRNITTRVIAMISIMDDIYDAYGTIDELELLTNAIDKWDIEVIDELPKYLHIYYKALLDLYNEIEELLVKQGRSFRCFYAKEAMKGQAKFYFREAQWYNLNYTPTLEEYLSLAMETTAYGLLATTSLVGMGDVASREAFDWVFTNPKLLKASKVVCRLMDDIVSSKFEQKRGHVTSAVECHIRDYGLTEEEAKKLMWEKIESAWKDINQELMMPTQFPSPILTRVLNFTRVMEVLYKDGDYYTHSTVELKAYIHSLLNNTIPI